MLKRNDLLSSGRFKIDSHSKIGSGQFAEVYSAVDITGGGEENATKSGRFCAIKIESEMKTTKREAMAMRNLSGGKGIVEIYEEGVFETKRGKEHPFIAMQLVGENLADLKREIELNSSNSVEEDSRGGVSGAGTTTTPKTRPPFLSTRLRASFEKIDISSVSSSSDDTTKNDDDDDDDDESDKELPNDLFDAVNTAASSTSRAISAGQLGIIVELLIPELWDPISGNVMANPGDQLKQWEISRQFAQKLLEERSDECEVTVVFPDAGCAALLKNRWGDNLKFKIASANDRMLVPDDYEGILLFAAADPISLDVVVKSTKKANELQNPVILLNPRLASGDAGIGLTVRRWRDQFLGVMCVAYSLRPLPWCNGTVFKKFPGPWKLYIEKENVPGRFELVHESNSRPAGDELDDLVSEAYRGRDVGEDGEMREKSAVEKLAGFAASMARFAKSLSN